MPFDAPIHIVPYVHDTPPNYSQKVFVLFVKYYWDTHLEMQGGQRSSLGCIQSGQTAPVIRPVPKPTPTPAQPLEINNTTNKIKPKQNRFNLLRWDMIKHIFQSNKGTNFAKHDKRDLMNAVLHLAKTGCRWRLLPK